VLRSEGLQPANPQSLRQAWRSHAWAVLTKLAVLGYCWSQSALQLGSLIAMLAASGAWKLGREATIRSTFILAPGLRAHAIVRHGLIFDSRFLPVTDVTSVAVIHLVTRGTVEIMEPSRAALMTPIGWLAREDHFEGPMAGRKFAVRSKGDPYTGLDVRVLWSLVRLAVEDVPQRFELDNDLVDLIERTLPRAQGGSANDAIEPMRAVLDALADREILERGGFDRVAPFDKLWGAIKPLAERFYVLPTLQEVSTSTGTSLRQLARDLGKLMGMTGLVGGWRDTTRRLRITLAVVGLSAPDTSIADVARAVGYGSVEAMARAFRDAELPVPGAVRAALCAD
jgi:AraC-like DNA-binding protein